MIPAFDERTGNLPAGMHPAAWPEFRERFGGTEHRRALVQQLGQAMEHLSILGCQRIYLGGSLVTAQEPPDGYVACWDPAGVVVAQIEPLFPGLWPVDLAHRRLQRETYGGALFPASYPSIGLTTFLDLLQRERRTGEPKGIILIEIESAP